MQNTSKEIIENLLNLRTIMPLIGHVTNKTRQKVVYNIMEIYSKMNLNNLLKDEFE